MSRAFLHTARVVSTTIVASLVLTGVAPVFAQTKKGEAGAKTGAKQPEAAPPAVPPAGGEAAPESPPEEGNQVQLRALEQKVNELKERIFRSKARLNLLKETVLHGVIAGSRAIIRHKNDMGSSFRLTRAVYAVDGAQVYSKADESGSFENNREFDLFNGSITPGSHTVSVELVFRGHGYGVFSYLKGYLFTVRASHTFTAAEGRQVVLNIRAFEKGNMTTELKDRPAIKFETTLFSVTKSR